MVHVCRLLNDLYIFLMPVNGVCHSFSNVMEMSREKLSHFRSPSDPGVSRQQSNAPINGRYIKHAFFYIKKVCLVHAYLFVIIQLNVLYLYFKRYNYTPTTKCGGGLYWIRFVASVGRSVSPSVGRSVRLQFLSAL